VSLAEAHEGDGDGSWAALDVHGRDADNPDQPDLPDVSSPYRGKAIQEYVNSVLAEGYDGITATVLTKSMPRTTLYLSRLEMRGKDLNMDAATSL